MGWTRHLYDLATVEEAILYTVQQFRNPLRKLQLAFWVRELLESEEYDRLREAMLRAYMQAAPPQVGGWEAYGRLLRDPTSEENVLEFLGYLQFPVKAAMIPLPAPAAAAAAAFKPKEGEVIPASPTNWSESQRGVLWRAVRDAWKRGNGERLYRLLGALKPATALQYAPELQQQQQASADILRAYREVGAGLQHVLCSAGLLAAAEFAVGAAKWPTRPSSGMRAARLFAIPRPIHARAPPMHAGPEGILDGSCAFWRRVGGGEATEEAAEEFYTRYFTDDIPDEWPAAEREKSHRGFVTAQ